MANEREELTSFFAGSSPGVGGSLELILQHLEPLEQSALRAAGIPHQFNVEILLAMLPGHSHEAITEAYNSIAGLSIFAQTGDALFLHDEARRFLFEWWIDNQREQMVCISHRLADYFSGVARDASAADWGQARIEAVFHRVGADPPTGVAELEEVFQDLRHRFQLADCHALIQVTHEYDRILNRPEKTLLAFYEAVLLTDMRQWDQAKELFESILVNNAGCDLEARVMFRLGMLHASLGEWPQAIDYYSRVLDLGDQAGTPHLPIQARCHLAAALRDTGRLDDAEQLLNQCAGLVDQHGSNADRAMLHNAAGIIALRRGKAHIAIMELEQAMRYLDPVADDIHRMQIYINLGGAYSNQNQWDEARRVLEEGLEAARKAGDSLSQGRILNNMMKVLTFQGRDEQGLEAIGEAIELFLRVHNWREAAVALRNQGRLFKRVKKFDQAERHFIEAQHLFQRIGADGEVEALGTELHFLRRSRRLPGWVWFWIILFLGISMLLILFQL